MRDRKRILKKLEKLWDKPCNRDMRLGQLLENYIFFEGGDEISVKLFNQEDDKTEKILDKVLK